ncbi:MAG: hypothetical protein MUO23_08560 [Anaerolineales bacterium]|nr:hypothetical protein [Anaerolineales bacterium]
MPGGIPVARSWIYVLKSGEVIVDWGEGRVQDIASGDFLTVQESDYDRPVTDSELDHLKMNGRIERYDTRLAHLLPLPEPPRRALE